MIRFIYLFLLGWIGVSRLVIAAPVHPISYSAVANITPTVSLFRDATRQLTLAQVQHKPYTSAESEIINLGFSPDAVWLKFTLQQPVNQPTDYVLQLTSWYVDEADLYSPNPMARSGWIGRAICCP